VRIGYQKLGLLMLLRGYTGFEAALAVSGAHSRWSEYDGGLEIVEALRAGDLDVGVLGDCPAVFAQAQDVPIVSLAAEPPAPHGAALIVPEGSPLQQVADLRGRRVAVYRAAQAHYLLLRALEEAGVEPDEVDLVFQPPERALRSFRSGEVDAWAIWDPWLSSARIDFRARVLRDATGLSNNSVYYVARRDFASRHPELARELLAQIENAARWVRSDPEQAAARLAPALGLSSRALAASWQRELGTIPVDDRLLAAQQSIADTLLRLRMISRPVSVAEAQWPLPLAG
jgi:sulfonate transport system substrate-binding protein